MSNMFFLSREDAVNQAQTALNLYGRFRRGRPVELEKLIAALTSAHENLEEFVQQDISTLSDGFETYGVAEVVTGVMSLLDMNNPEPDSAYLISLHRRLEAVLDQYNGSELDPVRLSLGDKQFDEATTGKKFEASTQERAIRGLLKQLYFALEVKLEAAVLKSALAVMKSLHDGEGDEQLKAVTLVEIKIDRRVQRGRSFLLWLGSVSGAGHIGPNSFG